MPPVRAAPGAGRPLASPCFSVGVERHAEEVELDQRPAVDQRQVVVQHRIAVRVTDHHPSGIHPLLIEDGQLGGTHVDTACVEIARPVRRRAARHRHGSPLLGRRDPRLVRPDLTQDPDPDAGVPHPRPSRRGRAPRRASPPIASRSAPRAGSAPFCSPPPSRWAGGSAPEIREPGRVTAVGQREVREGVPPASLNQASSWRITGWSGVSSQ